MPCATVSLRARESGYNEDLNNKQTKDMKPNTHVRKNTSAGAFKKGKRIHISYSGTDDLPTMQCVRIAPAKAEKSTSETA